MKKLIVLMVVVLVMGLLTGCWLYPESKIISICVEPEEMFLGPEETEPIVSVTANYGLRPSGDIELTDCKYSSNAPEVAVVEIVGEKVWIRAVGVGEAVILVTHTQHSAWTGMRVRTAEVEVKVE